MSTTGVLHLFEGVGIELEYMVVDRASLNARTIVDELIAAKTGKLGDGDYEAGPAAWSNELTAHVLEFKTNGPAKNLLGLTQLFQQQVQDANATLAGLGACLLPGGMHPWLDPMQEMKLWPHEYNEVYSAYNRIYDCRGHGWANLQSTHINLPFNGDAEFARLHAAIRLVLPLIPALAASSPVMDGALTGMLDSRLEVYRTNSTRVPLATAEVIPERAWSHDAYQREILQPLYAQLEPHDPDNVLRYEYANSRGAIARFDRDAIEIRVVDIQECPLADMAVCSLIIGAVRALCEERFASTQAQQAWEVAPLAKLFCECVADGGDVVIRDPAYAALFGVQRDAISVRELWRELAQHAEAVEDEVKAAQAQLLEHGCLSERLRKALGAQPDRAKLHEVWSELAGCLAEGRLFHAC